MPRSGTSSVISGESWFGVETTARPVPSQISQVHPEPNRLTPPSFTAARSWSASPKVSATASPNAPDGSPPPPGFMISQKREWFAWPPPLLRTAARLSSGISSSSASTCSSGRPSHSLPSSALLRLSTYAW
jgi:hypothetical protein